MNRENVVAILDARGRAIAPAVAAAEPAAVVTGASDMMTMFERLARDPNASVDKIERLMALWERGEANRAEAQFNAAMSEAQQAMRPVEADAYNPSTKSRYASYEALDSALRPIYTKHGFALSFNTADAPLPDYIRVLCAVTHTGGCAKSYAIDMPTDGKGARGGDVMTKTHAVGSGVSYGMRYLLKMIFNVAVGESDDDGNAAGKTAHAPTAPDGYAAWWASMEKLAAKGFSELEAAWRDKAKTPGLFKNYLTKHNREGWEALKAQALKVQP